MGLHLNVPQTVLPDSTLREHRRRLWWTAYTFDRMWSAKLGFPPAISDEDIAVEAPSNLRESAQQEDLPDCSYLVAMIGLARLSSRIMSSIYGTASQRTSLSQRVQSALNELRTWKDELPQPLASRDTDIGAMDPRTCSLHLMFNQVTISRDCPVPLRKLTWREQLLIISTRPILLHVVRTRLTQSEARSQVPDAAMALADTCVICARHSYSLLIESWTNGSLMIFDYFDTQYMFSSATVLALSVIRDIETSTSDRDRLECISQFLTQLKDSGNFAAAEFHQHISAIMSLTTAAETRCQTSQTFSAAPDFAASMTTGIASDTHSFPDAWLASGITLEDPLFHDLLAQPATDLQFIDEASFNDADLGLPWLNMEG